MKKKFKKNNLKLLGLVSLAIIGIIFINDQAEEYGFAQLINLPGRTIDLNQSPAGTDVKIQYPTGSGINVQQPTGPSGTSTIKTPGRTTTISPGSVQTSTGVLNINVDGRQVQINTSAGGLDAQVNRGLLDSAAKEAIISLEGGTDVLIKSNQDFETYKNLVIEQCSGVRTISTPGTTVQIEYSQPARFLGVFKSNLDGEVEISDSRDVKIKLPWYKFLFKKNSKQIEAQIENNLSGVQLQVTSGGSSVQIQRQARTISVVTSAISVYSTPCGTTVTKTSPTATPKSTATSTPKSTTQPSSSGLNPYVGSWHGSFWPNSLSAENGCVGGTVSITVASDGKFQGPATIEGDIYYGGGTVDSNGKISGGWTLSGDKITFSGQMSGNSGSGSYGSIYTCLGSFSLSR